MSYLEDLKTIKTPSFYKKFFDLLSEVKSCKTYYNENNLSFFYISILPIFAQSFNNMMSYYMENASEQSSMDKDFNNIFLRNKGKYLTVAPDIFNHTKDIIQERKNFSLNFTDKITNKDFPVIYPKDISLIETFFPNYKRNIDYYVQLIYENQEHSYLYSTQKNKSQDVENSNQKSSLEFLQISLKISEENFYNIFQLGLYGHTNKLRDFLLNNMSSKTYQSLFLVPDISTYSKVYFNEIVSYLPYSLDKKDFFQKTHKNLKFFDKDLINQLVVAIAELKTSNGIIKDIDSFNVPLLSFLETAFEERFDDFEKENIVKLRILRNIAKDKGISLDYVDERASVNSLTDKKLLIFADKVNCEVIIIDMQTLISRFPSRKSNYLQPCIKAFFSLLKEDKIFQKILITEGKRSYSHLLTVFCEKAKNHTEEKLADYSSYFEEAMFLSEQNEHVNETEFLKFLEQAKRTVSLKNQLDDNNDKIINKKLKI